MGPLEDGDTEIKPMKGSPSADVADTRTQPFDTQALPSSLHACEDGGNADELQFVQNNVPLDDTVPVEDGFETQVVDIGCETQVLDVLDYLEDMGTQLIDEFNNHDTLDSCGKGTDGTEVLCDDDELSDGESGRRNKCKSFDGKHIQCTSLCQHVEKGLMDQSYTLTDDQRLDVSIETPVIQVIPEPKTESVQKFTSVRASAFRASGLAARAMASKRTKSISLLTNRQSSEQHTAKINGSNPNVGVEVEQVLDTGRFDDEMKGFSNGNSPKAGCTAIRRLFVENGLCYKNDDLVRGKELLPLSSCDDVLAGLSYVDSQEPGESSQANALACVQRLIDENKELFNDDINKPKSIRGKSTNISTAKGPQSLSKRANDKDPNGQTRIFDWDDGCEDEGGGDIFRRRKEAFFGRENLRERSFKKSQKCKGNQPCGYRDNEGKSDVQNETMVDSDSKVVLQNLNVNDRTAEETEINIRKNLVNDFDVQLNATLFGKDMPEVPSVGLDTQAAAEAMEALFYGKGIAIDGIANVGIIDDSAKDAHLAFPANSKHCPQGSPRRRARKSVHSKQCSLNDNDAGVDTRQSKNASRIGLESGKQCPISSSKLSENFRKECDTGLVLTRRKRTRSTQQSSISQLKNDEDVLSNHVEETNCAVEVGGLKTNVAGKIGVKASEVLDAERKSSELGAVQFEETFKSKLTPVGNDDSYPKGRRSHQNLPCQLDEPDNFAALSKPPGQPRNVAKSTVQHKRLRSNARITSADLNAKRITRSSISVFPDLSSIHQNLEEQSLQTLDKSGSDTAVPRSNSVDMDGKKMTRVLKGAKAMRLSDSKCDADSSPSAANGVNASSNKFPRDATKPSESAYTSPVNCLTPVNAASPICMGNEYFKQSCKKNLLKSCLMRELSSLYTTGPEPISAPKDSRKKRDLTNVQVLFSHHLDEDIVRHQKKIVDRLNLSIASSITDATHFVADTFVRTRNMLEAIASGKPVVTHLWLENVGLANYYIDEQNYILRDSQKEKEFGFNMPVSLAHARQHPLLQDRRVFVTPSTKPGHEIICSLVKAVCGQPVERVGRSALRDDICPDDLLVLSCEEDYEVCLPFLERGVAVYSSELLLNGIVTQRLDYVRHKLFADRVKRTRSTTWLKKDGHNFIPVTKHK